MQLNKGDILLIHSRTLIARAIQLGMNIERWHWFSFKPFWKKVANHAAICISDGVIAEATAAGIIVHQFKYAYKNKKNTDFLVYRPSLTKSERQRLIPKATEYAGVKYQFVNFLQYIPKILFGIWLGRTHASAEDKLYCTEYVALVLNKITCGGLFEKYWRTSPSGLQSWCGENAQLIYEFKT